MPDQVGHDGKRSGMTCFYRSGMTCIINEQSLHLYDIITLTYEKDSCCFTDI